MHGSTESYSEAAVHCDAQSGQLERRLKWAELCEQATEIMGRYFRTQFQFMIRVCWDRAGSHNQDEYGRLSTRSGSIRCGAKKESWTGISSRSS